MTAETTPAVVGLIGSRVRKLREDRGYTLRELGEKLHKDPRQVWRWETEGVDPNGAMIRALAYHLETTSDYLLGLTDDPTPRLTETTLTSDEHDLILLLRRRQADKAAQTFIQLTAKNG